MLGQRLGAVLQRAAQGGSNPSWTHLTTTGVLSEFAIKQCRWAFARSEVMHKGLVECVE